MTSISNTTYLSFNRLVKNLGFIAAAASVSSATLFGATTALILPHRSPAEVHRSIGVMGTRAFQKNDSFGSVHQPRPPQSSQRHPSTLLLGPGNNNNNNNNNKMPSNGGGGVSDMEPGLKLLVCILIDFIGVASFAAPGLGEATDVGWAPISAFLVNYLFGNGVFTALALVEELSPGFDFIPTATIAWFFENANREESSGAGAPPPSQSSAAAASTPSQSPPQTRKNKPAESDVIDVDIVD